MRRSAARVRAVLDAPAPVREPAAPLAAPRRAGAARARAARRATATRGCSTASTSTSRPAAGSRVVGPERRGQVDAGRGAAALPRLRGLGDARRRRARARSTATPYAPSSGSSRRTRTCSTRRCARTCCSPAATRPRPTLEAALARARLLTGRANLPADWRPRRGPGGQRLSGGERRRIALARAELAALPAARSSTSRASTSTRATADAIVADALAHRPRHAADHPPPRRPRGHGRDRRARGGPRRRARHARRAPAPRRALRRAGRVRSARAQDVDRPGHDQEHHGVGDQRLHRHQPLGAACQRHRVRRADRDRVGQRHVEVVAQPRGSNRFRGVASCGNCEVGVAAVAPRRAAADRPRRVARTAGRT